MPIKRVSGISAAIAALVFSVAGSGAALAAGFASIPTLVTAPVDDAQRVVLRNNTHPVTRKAADRGPVDPALSMKSIRLVLKRSAAQKSALEKYMAEQTDPTSSNFHHWLTPQQFGALYGPADRDLEAVTTWLKSQGFTIDQVSKGRIFVDFSGSANLVNKAFRTEMHHYQVNGKAHIANNADPSIPAALAPVVAGIASLHDFFAKPMHTTSGAMHRSAAGGKWLLEKSGSAASAPQFLSGSGDFEAITPSDIATIYNVLPLWNAGIDGSGQTIAIAGQSDVVLADIAKFRSLFGLPPNLPNIIVNGVDPGTPGDEDFEESTLDLEWSGAVAKGATIEFVTTASTSTTGGVLSSALYIIDNQIAPVMSLSYGECELYLGTAGNATLNALWQQAAAQGITVMVAAGDAGSAACDQNDLAASHGLQVSGYASTPYNVAVGGTDFNWINQGTGDGADFSQYWNSTTAVSGTSALGYIPEVTWNSTCASTSLQQLLENPKVGLLGSGTDPQAACEELQNSYYIDTVAGSGGVSACTQPGDSDSSCSGGYAKPAWQAGIGVPADGQRDLPDVSLFAANGYLNNAYVYCVSNFQNSGMPTCSNAISSSSNTLSGAGGTSFGSPIMAGILALVNQKMASPQGNANVVLYGLAALDDRTGCNTNTVAAGNSCNFYDITTDNNAVPCASGTPNCNTASATDLYGVLSGYSSTAGYDLSTGLGSLNVTNVVNHWSQIAGSPTQASVPNLVGLIQADAIAAITSDQLTVGTVTTVNSSTIPAGDVISQSTVAGTIVGLNAVVNLVISSNPFVAAVPNVVGDTQAVASTALGTVGLSVGSVSTQSSMTVATGLVISQDPSKNAAVRVGSNVNLVISAGLPVPVPNVVGLTQDAALTAITGAGLVVGTVTTQFDSTVPQGLVISESPAAGTNLKAGSGVNLVISAGVPVSVPNVVGLTQDAALTEITGAGLVVATVTQQFSATVPQGIVLIESPAAGTNVKAGSGVYLVVSKAPAGPSSGIILTVAGNGKYSYAGVGDGELATAAEFGGAESVAVDSGGNLYIGEETRVRKVSASTGIISTIAGTSTIGFSGDGGPATSAELYIASGLAADSAGNLYIADVENSAIRKISATTGIITTVAGNGTIGFSGDGGPATSAALSFPSDVAIDSEGNLYIADSYNNVIREVMAATGIIRTIAGNGTGAGTGNGGYSGDGGSATSAEFNYPSGVAVDPTGNLYIADSYNNVIREVTAATGIISTVAGNGTGAGTGNGGYSGDGGPATNAQFNYPSGVAVDPAGNLYIADYYNNVVRLVSVATGIINTVAGNGTGAGTGNGGYSGDGGPATSAQLYGPSSVYLDSAGNLYIADSNNNVVREVLALTPPTVTPTIIGTRGNNGWYTSNVQVSWAVSGGGAPITTQTGCGAVTISADTTGQNLTCSATSAGGTTNQSVKIKRDATPPQAAAIPSPVPNSNGWNDTSVTVTFTGTDATSGIASCSAPVTITTQGANQTSQSGTCTDNAGNLSAPVTATGINIDEALPTISDVIFDSVPESASGWYTAPVTVSFSGTDALSGVAPNGCTSPVTLSTNGANQSVTGTCTNRAGEVAKLTVSGIKIDTIPPVATAAATPPPNANGWNKTPVTVSFSGTDNFNGSGVASCSPSVTVSTNGAVQKPSGTCIDVAGNVSAPATATVSIDQIPPTVNVTAPTNGATYTIGATVAAAFTCADALSGLATCVGTVANGVTISTATTGSHAFNVTATDVAGNVIQSNIGYSVALASQTITFGAIASQMAGTKLALQATASSGLPVTFTSSPSNVCTVSGSTASLLAVGTCTITASQSGNASYSAAKSVSQSFTVTPKLISDTVTLGISSATEAYSVRNHFAIGPSYTGSPVPTGTVTLYDNSTALVTLTLGSNGVAYYTANPLNAGVHVLTASYNGDAHYAPGVSAPVTLTVTPAPVILKGSCWGGTPYELAYQCVVTASATTATPPTGSIICSLDGASGTSVALSNGSASFTVATLPAGGAHKLTIAYPGQGNYAAGTTLTESFTTAPGQTHLLLNPSSYYLAPGSSITLTVAASTPQSGMPPGSVTFYDNGTALGTATIGSNGVATYAVARIAKGINTYTARYAATLNYAAATSNSAAVTAH
jgi:beta-lactam-binding protein with PASTA domain